MSVRGWFLACVSQHSAVQRLARTPHARLLLRADGGRECGTYALDRQRPCAQILLRPIVGRRAAGAGTTTQESRRLVVWRLSRFPSLEETQCKRLTLSSRTSRLRLSPALSPSSCHPMRQRTPNGLVGAVGQSIRYGLQVAR